MSQLNLFKYFRASSLPPQVALPSPNGLLSLEVVIGAANKEVEEVMASISITKREEFIGNIYQNRPSILIIKCGST